MESNIIFKNEQKSQSVVDGKILIGAMYEDNFGVLLPYIRDIEVTDINWNGKDLWIDDVSRGRYCAKEKLSKEFVDAFCVRVANVVSRTFNKYYPKLEAETDDLRITILHHTVSHTGTTISIRKTPVVKRITFAKSVQEDFYCPTEVANFLSNAVKAKFNIVIGGLPGVGKTELVKYLTNYIFPRDRVITIEDTMEIHYSKINPNKDCVELKVDDHTFTYTEAIKSCLRLLPQWILLSEARSKEVQYLLESISTGAKCITTIHTDDMRKVPKRVVNMLGDLENSTLAEAMAYSYFDVGILVDKTQDKATGKIDRFISQVVMYYEEDNQNKLVVLYDHGKLTGNAIPEEALYQFARTGIEDPWMYTFIEDTVQDIDDSTGFLEDDSDEYTSAVDNTTGVMGGTTSRYVDEQDDASGNVDPSTKLDESLLEEDVIEEPVVESENDSEEDDPTGVMPSEERSEEDEDDATGVMSTDEQDKDDATGVMSTGEQDEDDATGVMPTDDQEDAESEQPTGYVEEGDIVGTVGEVDSEQPTGYVDEDNAGSKNEVDSEESTDFIGEQNSKSNHKSGKRGRNRRR